MFNNHTWSAIIREVKYLPSNSQGNHIITTYPGSNRYYLRVKGESVYVAPKAEPDRFSEIPREEFEAIYNDLYYNRNLTRKELQSMAKAQFADLIVAILGLLPDIDYDRETGKLVYHRK